MDGRNIKLKNKRMNKIEEADEDKEKEA